VKNVFLQNPKLLLHVCCAPCACYVIELLKNEYDIILFFYNPNIQPVEEYNKRLNELKKFAELKSVKLIIQNNIEDEVNWKSYISGYESEPEGGYRCRLCYEFRLKKTAEFAKKNFIDNFGTVLTISPHKKSQVINELGNRISSETKVNYLESDFKKKDGFKKASVLSKQYNFYRQNYCGCLFSINIKS
jgi:predicted adenine nucleotide alpha hydrolase (AANH) superfamily ATPase